MSARDTDTGRQRRGGGGDKDVYEAGAVWVAAATTKGMLQREKIYSNNNKRHLTF